MVQKLHDESMKQKGTTYEVHKDDQSMSHQLQCRPAQYKAQN